MRAARCMVAPRTYVRHGRQTIGLVMMGAALAGAEPFTETVNVPGQALVLNNLVGQVRVESHSGTGFVVEVNVQGEDATRERVRVREGTGGGVVLVEFPLDESRRYVYPKLRSRTKVNFRLDQEGRVGETQDDKVLRKHRGRRVEIAGRGSGLEIWADITVRVPARGDFSLNLGAGDIALDGLNGPVEARSHFGDVMITSCSGGLTVDTGYGDIDGEGVGGDVRLDTGNGEIAITGGEATTALLDTGNGDVLVRDLVCQKLEIDTGNGKISATDIVAEDATLDTGNGRVELSFARLGQGRYVVDTGNGSITLHLPTTASADVEANTGHGRVRLEIDEELLDIMEEDRDEIRFRIGTGEAHIRLDSGNGSIRIKEA